MKKTDTFLKEFVTRTSIDNLKNMSVQLENRIGSDLAEAIETMQTNQDIDRWLVSAKSHEEFYDMIDLAQEYIDRELNKRAPELVS